MSKVVRDFLIQCFQKDPNLRVSARKLLKHPWIVNARRSDSIVPRKPTEYDEAVKSVQQWNEALKSPNAGSLRRVSRPLSSSPNPCRREPPPMLATPAKGPMNLIKPRLITEQFRSPDSAVDDNWDDDFASAISLSVLQLPHLRPHDNFSGLLSSDKIKAYASFKTVAEETKLNRNHEGDRKAINLQTTADPDPLQTIRPCYPKCHKSDQLSINTNIKSQRQRTSSTANQPLEIIANLTQNPFSNKQRTASIPSTSGSETRHAKGTDPATMKNVKPDDKTLLKMVNLCYSDDVLKFS